jgi:hypothetical protein
MSRTKLLLIAASCATAIATATPALALNPQPLPPGRAAYQAVAAGHQGTVFCASGTHHGR